MGEPTGIYIIDWELAVSDLLVLGFLISVPYYRQIKIHAEKSGVGNIVMH
jgi:hypothetical protein